MSARLLKPIVTFLSAHLALSEKCKAVGPAGTWLSVNWFSWHLLAWQIFCIFTHPINTLIVRGILSKKYVRNWLEFQDSLDKKTEIKVCIARKSNGW